MLKLVPNLYQTSRVIGNDNHGMAQQVFSGKEKVGRITIERHRESIRLRWMVEAKAYSLTIGTDCKETIKAARAKAQLIYSDILYERFDPTLEKYGKKQNVTLTVVQPKAKPELSLRELWDKFIEDKSPHRKAKTVDEYNNFTRLLDKLQEISSDALSYDALKTKQHLLKVTTTDQTRRMLQYLSAACKWGVKHRLITDNPYEEVHKELPRRKSAVEPTPNAFSEEEMLAVIKAFKTDERPGMNYRSYAPLVEFWFYSGCRPSEAIGLHWKHVKEDCSVVNYQGSIQTVRGRPVWSDGSKNNKVRTVALSKQAQDLLLSIKKGNPDPESLVFPSPKGKAVNYPNFIFKIWHKLVDPIKPGTTPYCCRDTFITHQLMNGVAVSMIEYWCDTSAEMINRHYADRLKLLHIRPVGYSN